MTTRPHTNPHTTVILSDNGSLRPAATLSLRRIATALSRRLAMPVHPVSLQHADRIDAERLAGKPAHTLAGFLQRQAEQGARQFVIVPLFFGPSRALTALIPQVVGTVQTRFTDVRVNVAQTLCPLPAGEPRLVEMLLASMPDRGEYRTGDVSDGDWPTCTRMITAVDGDETTVG